MTPDDKKNFAAAIMAAGAIAASGPIAARVWEQSDKDKRNPPDWDELVVTYFDKVRGRLEEMKIF